MTERKSQYEGRPSDSASPRVLMSPPRNRSEKGDGYIKESGDADHVLPSKFYLDRQASTTDVKRRHEKFGYDPLDRALQEEKNRLEKKKKGVMASVFGEKKLNPQEEYEHNVKKLLRDHLSTMESHGIVFHHDFVEDKLGFAILVARYGTEGRKFIQVEETFPHCECYPEILKPTDELIEVNGKLILLPQHDDPKEHEVFEVLRKKIAESKRPLKLTFIHGERRDEAFLEQENRREMRGLDRPDATKSALRGESEQCVRMAAMALDALKNAAASGDGETGSASKSKIDAQVSTCTHLAKDAAGRKADFRYAAQEKEVEATKKITTDNLSKCQQIQQEAAALLASLLDKLAAEQLLIDEASRYAAAGTEARETAEEAADQGHAQTLLSAVEDAKTAEAGAKNVLNNKLDQATCFPNTTASILASVKTATEERERAEAAHLKFISAQAAGKCDPSKLGTTASSEYREADEDSAMDASKEIDDALARLAQLRNRLRTDPKANSATVKAVDDAYAAVKNDHDAAQAGMYAASAKKARDEAEAYARDNNAPAAEDAAARAADAEQKVKDLKARIANEADDDDNSKDAANRQETNEKVNAAVKSATSDRIVAEAAAAKAKAQSLIEESDGQDSSAIDAALQRIRDLLNRARTDPEATDEAKATVAAYARDATGNKHLTESQQQAAAAAKAREETQAALERKDFDEAKKAAERAGAAAVAAGVTQKAVDKDEHASDDTKSAVAASTSSARDDAALAEASRFAAAAKAAREDADSAAEKGDASEARAAATRAATAGSEAAGIVTKTAALQKKNHDKLSDAEKEKAAQRLVELSALAAGANDDKNLADAATALAAARAARKRAEDAVARAGTDPKAGEAAASAATEASQAAAKATLVAGRVNKDDAASDSTKSSVMVYAGTAAAEAAKAAMAQQETASVEARKRAEDAVIESDAPKAEAAALDAASANQEAQVILSKLEEDTSQSEDSRLDARAAAARIRENQQQAEAAKFAAAAAQARKNAQKAADEGDLTAAEDATNDAVEAELGVLELLSSVEADEASSADHKAKIAAAAASTTEDRQLADAAKFAAMAAAGKREAQEAAKRIDVDGAASAADSAARGEEGLLELAALVEADSATSDATRNAIRAAAVKAGEDRQIADAAKLVAAARRAREEAEAAAKEGDAAAAEAFANAAADAHAGVVEMVEQMGSDASKNLIDELTAAEGQTRDEARRAEAAKFAAMAAAARAAAEAAAAKGDMYKCAEAASDARTAEAGAMALKKEVDEDSTAPEATKKAITAAARKTTDARRVAEAAKCAAMSASARADAQKAAREAPLAPNADEAMTLAEQAGEAEDTVEEALKQIQDILSNLRNDKTVSHESKVAIAKYAQPIIEDRHLAEAAKLAASATAARRAAEEAAESGALEACSTARSAFHGLDHDATQLRELTDTDPTLSAESKASVADAADHVAAERRVAEAAECAARAAAARKQAVEAAGRQDVDTAEKAVAEARDADDIAQAILEEARVAGGDLVPLVEQHAKRAQDERILAEAALLAARSKRARESVEAAATVADKGAADIGKAEIAQAQSAMREIEGLAASSSDPTRNEVAAFRAAVDADFAAVKSVVVPDKAALASEVISKAASLASEARAARQQAEKCAKANDDEGARRAADLAQEKASALAALDDEVSKSAWYDASTKHTVHVHAEAAAEDARRAASAVSDLALRRAEEALAAKRKAEEEAAAAKRKAEEEAAAAEAKRLADEEAARAAAAGDEMMRGKRTAGDESKDSHFYDVTHSRFYMMPDNEEGVRLRDLAKAAAQEVAKALADTRKAVKILLDPSQRDHKQGGADWKMNAVNNAAAAVTRAQKKAKELQKLAKEAEERAARFANDESSTKKQIDRAGATSSVVTGFCDVAQADSAEADALLRSTHVVKSRRRGSKTETYEKNTPSDSGIKGRAAPRGPQRGDQNEDQEESSKYSSALADVQRATNMHSGPSADAEALGIAGSAVGDGRAGGAKGGSGRRDPRRGSSSAGVNLVESSLAFTIPDKEEGMKLRDLGRSYAMEASKALADTKEAVAVMTDAKRRNSVQAGAQWKMHALNNAAAAMKRARVAATRCASLAKDATARSERVKTESSDASLHKSASATAAVVTGFSSSANSDANEADAVFQTTSVFKRPKQPSGDVDKMASIAAAVSGGGVFHDDTPDGLKLRSGALKCAEESSKALDYVKLSENKKKRILQDDLSKAVATARFAAKRSAEIWSKAVDRKSDDNLGATKTAELTATYAATSKANIEEIEDMIKATGIADENSALEALATRNNPNGRNEAIDASCCFFSPSLNLEET